MNATNSTLKPQTRKKQILKKIVSFVAGLLFISATLHAQKLNSIVRAEFAFAKQASIQGIKTTFLANLDSEGVVFNRKNIYNDIRLIAQLMDEGSGFIRRPVYALTSSLKEPGLAPGIYEVKGRDGQTIPSTGQYKSIWKKNKQGEGELLIDVGVDHKSTLYNGALSTILISNAETERNNSDFQRLENAVQKSSYHDSEKALNDTLTDETIPGRLQLVSIPVKSEFSGMKELMYVYGVVEYEGRKENYLRIWGHTRKGWKIMLQVLKW